MTRTILLAGLLFFTINLIAQDVQLSKNSSIFFSIAMPAILLS